MEEIEQLVAKLTFPQTKIAYGAFKELEALSQRSDEIYPYFDTFCAMLDAPNSYVRTRGLVLAAQNARWDREEKLEPILDAYLAHVTDEKPITARQCIQNLSAILMAKPKLSPRIRKVLEQADFSQYPDSMSPLLQQDAIKILKQIDQIHQR